MFYKTTTYWFNIQENTILILVKKKLPEILENRVLIWYKIIETSVKYDTDIT